MISNQLTTIKLDNGKLQMKKDSNDTQQFSSTSKNISINNDMKCDDNIITSIVSTTTDNNCQINSNQSTHISYQLFSKSKTNLNKYNQITSDYIDWMNHQSNQIINNNNNQLDAIHFLQEYLQNGKSDILIDLLYEIAQELNHEKYNSYSAINNNHFHLTPRFNSNFQLSNNKEKKNKKEKSDQKERKDDKKEENNEMTSKKPKKSKEKVKKIEETTTTDSDIVVNSPSLINPTHINLPNPKSPSETIGFPSLSIPVPHSSVSSTNGLISSDPSRIRTPQQSNSKFAYLSQVQHQLQTDPQNPSLSKTTCSQNISVQQQLQSLSQMARDGDEILITLTVNALTQKQQINNNNNDIQYNQSSFQNNPYSSQPWNQTIPSTTGVIMPRNLEIVAKGFARVQNEHPQPPPSNPYPQQQSTMPSYNQLPFTSAHPPITPRYPMPCYSSNGPPQIPIGPPIQPIFAPPNMMMSGGFIRPPNSAEFTPDIRNNVVRHHSHKNIGKCDYLCQSSLYQPDFRGRPSPNITTNPYFSNQPPPMNFSAKQSSKHKTKTKSNLNSKNINQTYSSIY